ncbi:3',5'-cyclic AMP phosphodiesterase CpdA [Actinokineospora alba]|uniref:3',5'-cyclic AMP phosphodiesterase CpdA n=1 Tax=Actinokineospora alba TaxID=504798 RepID=A0A1H0TNI0_9PSEU|nr:metallophosphoesterase [Actinokineospora alba]TDP70620.1 3',5'-cyclic AMP phosphodiesterase CpdA [Actinokineospora alba]SDJ11833.1 3',5'-cyclic AMP phosphodiesterase CpdA [Actinokineospora alba]SDP55493.1 3',5'-cyclic AMP phosphodiesterase CpdA [Actinokineospora alba]
MTPPPRSRPRPRTFAETELGFKPQPAVRWLAPKVLISTGIQSVIATIFGSYADKRELQGSLPATVHRYDDDDELWIDFVADVGDGFDATYSVATLLAAEKLDIDGHELPRGRLLIMGGDQVYPSASTRNYEDRTKGVYRAAFPALNGDAPTLFALPGNHDWYDGLTSFLRVFAQKRNFGGWDTEQTRSYFAIELPHRWWLFAIDTQFDDYIDAPQLEYFRRASAELRPGDGVILCTSAPAWVDAGSGGHTKSYDTFEFFDREIVRSQGASVRVMLSGDRHHYVRYAEHGGDRQRITCGLGGAYLAATHELPQKLVLPPPTSRVREPSVPADYELAERYPDRWTSERFAAGIFRLPWRNPGFWAMTGIFQTIMTLAVLYGLVQTLGSHGPEGFFGLVASWTPAILVGFGLVLGALAFARIEDPKRGWPATIAGVLHATGHVLLSIAWAFVVIWLYSSVLPDGLVGDWATLVIVTVGTPLLVGFVDAELVAVYLMIASRFGINLNEVMAGQSIEDYKGFLRLRIDDQGGLTIFPVKLETTCRAWATDPDAERHLPWLKPECDPLRPELIEEPITVARVSTVDARP